MATVEELIVPAILDYPAVFFFALTGALVAYRKDYDFVGMAALAFSVGLGGGLIRDGIFLQQEPAALLYWQYLAAVGLAVLTAILVGELIQKRFSLIILLLDAAGLGLFAVVGSQKSLNLGYSVYAAALVGLVNAVGGGILRDVLSGEDPIIFKPSQLYVVAIAAGLSVYLVLGVGFDVYPWTAALACIGTTLAFRMLTILLDLRTSPVSRHVWRNKMGRGVRSTVGKLRNRP